MNVKDFYNLTGSDYSTALTRLMNDAFIKRFVLKFKDNNSFNDIMKAYNDKDTKLLFEATHNMKGVAGNLSLTKLFDLSSEICEKARNERNFSALDIDNDIVKLKEAYNLIMDNIDKID